MTSPIPLFPLARVVATPTALEALAGASVHPAALLGRHVTGDWGALDDEDHRANEQALGRGKRIFSTYVVRGVKIWIITEADPSSTCILTRGDY